ncbi:gamma-glutamyltransferase [Puccinia triticina 1-1 BBBD Race 1]|uniref:Glutathione hydrolase n=2 Tax=Puccinia triticina TaxID=208348 RepID=A0A180GPW3_PUCT1|nr:uncharacterized protein PtA15_2A31 [Puccinia triticina]OAV94013.1 gamma-glutamyltransferase [Puccinia triticina 1-1 BBBD Race 1]WAQ81720.1 hypothetical protein PtA15_2A31 [Puccinia triticina]WAR52608.1 hypothetical protein PtB15_2B32 [Puccinia triticina]
MDAKHSSTLPPDEPLLPSHNNSQDTDKRCPSGKLRNPSNRACLLLLIAIPSLIWFRASNPSNSNLPNSSTFNPTHERNPSYLVSGKNGVVSSEEARCSSIGINVLKDNGTATDAAIATALCVGVVNSFSSGIGGGGFMIIKPPSGCQNQSTTNKPCSPQTPITIDFRETIPDGDFYGAAFLKDPSKSEKGGLSIGIPGELAGFEAAYRQFGGGVSWQRIFQPSIDLAKNFLVGPALADKLINSHWMRKKPEWQSVFQPNHRPAKVGDWIQRPSYARTLEIIAEQGIHPFYHGTIAQQLVETINRHGGKVTLADFENYQPIIDQAINTTYHGYNIWTTGPPSSGAILLHAMNILQRYSLHDHSRTPLAEHRFIESLKYAFSARTELGDPKFMNSSELARLDLIQSKSYGLKTSLKINDTRTYDYSHYKPKYDIVEDHGTTHLSVVDRFGSAVSLTSTVNLNFGSNVMDPINGVVLNDENDDFSIKGRSNAFDLYSSPLNYPITGKRPVSSMAPVIVDYLHPQSDSLEPEFFCALGASGGSRIFSAVIGTFLKLLWGYDISHAIEDARLHHQLLPNEVYVETSYRSDFLDSLKSKGHNITMIDIFYGRAAVQGIHKPLSQATMFGSGDSRKHGVPDAY